MNASPAVAPDGTIYLISRAHLISRWGYLVAVNNKTNPSAYIGRFFVDSLVHDPEFLRYMLKLMGARTIALGSDYPFPLGEDRPGAMIESMGLDEATAARLLHGSALEFLGLSRDRFQ